MGPPGTILPTKKDHLNQIKSYEQTLKKHARGTCEVGYKVETVK